jgi:hypothetical protein
MRAMRWVLLPLVFVVGCKKKEEPPPEPMTGPAPSGHSVTKVGEEGSGSGSAKAAATVASGSAAAGSAAEPAGATADAALVGGNGKPAYRDATGHVHGPGGPIFMGRGPDCTDKLDHCLRDGVWFAVGNIRPGSIYRAVPAFEFENKWWNFREEEADCHELFKTRVAKPQELTVGSPVIWLVEENQKFEWLNNESDALTSSRWEAGIIGEGPSGITFKVQGWDYPIRIDTARAVLERKNCPNAS